MASPFFTTAAMRSKGKATSLSSHDPRQPVPPRRLREARKLPVLWRVASIKYSTIDEAIEIANSTDYGLGGSVWGRDPAELDAVAHRMEAGTVSRINQHLVVSPNVPFGGNKDSGFGVQYGAEGPEGILLLARDISQDTEVHICNLA